MEWTMELDRQVSNPRFALVIPRIKGCAFCDSDTFLVHSDYIHCWKPYNRVRHH